MIRWLLMGGVLAPLLLSTIVFIVGQISLGYNPNTETISRLATYGAPFAELVIAGFILYGIFICITAFIFYRLLTNSKHVKAFGVFLALHGIFIILAAIFLDNNNPHNMWPMVEDILHNTFASISYLALIAGIIITTKYNYRDRTLRPIAILGLAVIILNIPLPIILIMRQSELVDGLVQRLSFVITMFWLIAISLQFYRLNRYKKSIRV